MDSQGTQTHEALKALKALGHLGTLGTPALEGHLGTRALKTPGHLASQALVDSGSRNAFGHLGTQARGHLGTRGTCCTLFSRLAAYQEIFD